MLPISLRSWGSVPNGAKTLATKPLKLMNPKKNRDRMLSARVIWQACLWLGVSIIGASALGGIALHRGETINGLWFIVAALCIYALGYRFYSAFIAAQVLGFGWHACYPG